MVLEQSRSVLLMQLVRGIPSLTASKELHNLRID